MSNVVWRNGDVSLSTLPMGSEFDTITGLVLRQENRNQFEVAEIAKWLVEND